MLSPDRTRGQDPKASFCTAEGQLPPLWGHPNPPRLATSIADLTPFQKAMCDDLLSQLAIANKIIVESDKPTMERRRERLWARVFYDWNTDCPLRHPREPPRRESLPVIRRPNPGLTMKQMRARAMAHWNRAEIQRVCQYNIAVLVYWARRRLIRDLRISMVVAHPSVFTRTEWIAIPSPDEDLAEPELESLGQSEALVRASGWDTEEAIGTLPHVDI
jgi:hypothetical protein